MALLDLFGNIDIKHFAIAISSWLARSNLYFFMLTEKKD
jgi:hypothetical protein